MWVAGWNAVDAHRCEQALQVLRASPDKPAIAAAMLEYSMICLTSARYREAIETFLRNHEFLLHSPDDLAEFNVSRASWMNLVATSWVPLFVGELGNSLTAFDAGILGCRKEGNLAGAQTLGLWRCLLLFQLTDYEGMLEMCRPIVSADSAPVVVLPFERRLSLVMCGLAEAGLGNAAAARDYLLEAERQIREQPVMLDWYLTLMLEWGRVNLLLLTGARAEAAARADRFIRLATETDERTWQALAFETWARVALGRGAATEALEVISKALAATKGFETPLADWRVHATATVAYKAIGNSQLASRHAHLAATTRRGLIESLPQRHRLRTLFETSARIFPPLASDAR
jgi:tetratricopeptide (TPR) repeat protein